MSDPMKRKSIYSYYAFGYNYRLLRSLDTGDHVHGEKNSAISRITGLFEKLKELDLQVTLKVSKDLQDVLEELESLPSDSKLDALMVKKAEAALLKLDPTLDAELQLRDSYIITPKRYDISKLLSRPAELLGEKVFQSLSVRSQKDLSLACACIAFSQPTASAFHILRATEETLKNLYFANVRKNRLTTPMWAGMVEALRKKKTHKLKPALLDQLDTIRKNYRNPTQHPDKFYDIDEAQDLLNSCIAALNMMSKEMPKKAAQDNLVF